MNHFALAAVLAPLCLLSPQSPGAPVSRSPARQVVTAAQVAPTDLPPFQKAATDSNRLFLRFVDPMIPGDAGTPGYEFDHRVADYIVSAYSNNGAQPGMGPMQFSGLFLRGLPELTARCAALEELNVVEVYSVTRNDEVQNKFTLRDVRIVEVSSGISATQLFESHLALDFRQLDWEYRFEDQNGALGPPQRGSFTHR